MSKNEGNSISKGNFCKNEIIFSEFFSINVNLVMFEIVL